jgi:hypothetical protein
MPSRRRSPVLVELLVILLLACCAVSVRAAETVEKPAAEAADREATDEGLVFSEEVEALLNQASDSEGYGEMERCINVRSIRDSQVLDNRHVVFRLSGQKLYLVQFQRTCHQLRRHSSISYEPRGNQLCRLDDIRAVNDFRPGGVGPPCSIPGFYEVSAEQVALLKEALKAESGKPKP